MSKAIFWAAVVYGSFFVLWVFGVFIFMITPVFADNNPYSTENNPYSTHNNPYSSENNRYSYRSTTTVREAESMYGPEAIRVQPMSDLPHGAIGIVNLYNDAGQIVGSRLVIIKED